MNRPTAHWVWAGPDGRNHYGDDPALMPTGARALVELSAAAAPAAHVADVHMSRYTIEWTNGPLPEGTALYAAPVAPAIRRALELARDALHHGGVMQTHKAIDAIDAALSAPAAPVAQPAGRMSRATMVLGSGAGYKEVAFRFADLEDAEQVRLWAETCGAKLDAAPAAPVAPASQPVSEPVQMTVGPADFLLRRIKHEKMLGPHEQAAIDFALDAIIRQFLAAPVARVRFHRTGGSVGLAWSAVPTEDAPMMREGDPLYAAPAAPVAQPVIPAGWVPLTMEWEPGYPEDVAFGPKRMMDRLKKWLDAHFARRLAESASQPVSEPAGVSEADIDALIASQDWEDGPLKPFAFAILALRPVSEPSKAVQPLTDELLSAAQSAMTCSYKDHDRRSVNAQAWDRLMQAVAAVSHGIGQGDA